MGLLGVDQHDGPGLGRDGPAQALRIDLPAVVVDQRRGFELHIVQHREKVEERVARLRDQDFAARIAEEAEEEAVGLAGAGGEDDLAGIEDDAVVGVIAANSLTCAKQASGLRIVVQGLGIGERRQQSAVEREAAASGIRGRKVGNRQSLLKAPAVSKSQLALLRVPVRSF